MVDVASLILEVSYGQATVVPRFRGAIQLAHNKDYYRDLTVEVTGSAGSP
jgi:hypothetical protein